MTQAADAVAATDKPLDPEERQFCALVGANSGYYLRVRRQIAATGNKLAWNWSAFLFSVVWMAYRRMWGPAIVIVVILLLFFVSYLRMFLTGIIAPDAMPEAGVQPATGILHIAVLLGVPLFCGLFGNHFYISVIHARMRRLGWTVDT